LKHWYAGLTAYWRALAPRERSGLGLAVGAVSLALVWSLLLAPPLRILRSAPATTVELNGAFEHMQRLQVRARALQAQAAVPPAELRRQLQDAVQALGSKATLQMQGDRAVLTLTELPSADLSAWLASDRGQGLRPVQVHLRRDEHANPSWTGSMVFQLPSVDAR